ncbi:sugar porter family MFS transporter [Streptomyces endocoffeicus]|nr:sugar porter family MFS transporter [Streptomyces endocoffeicus]
MMPETEPTRTQTATVSPPDAPSGGAAKPERFVRVITAIATLGALLFGYDTGVISGALPFMRDSTEEGGLGLTATTEGVVASSLVFGAAFGALLGGRLADRFGRRRAILSFAVVFFGGALGTALSPDATSMVVFRVILGLAVGGASATVPMFIAELSPAHRRGRLVSQNELMIVSGQLIAYTSNALIANFSDNEHAWRYMLGLATIPAVLLWCGMLFMPESPRWFAAKGRPGEALSVLRRIREHDAAQAELDEITERTHEAETGEMRLPWVRRLLMIGIVLNVGMQLTGVNAMVYLAPTLLESIGFGTKAALTTTIANGVVAVVAVSCGIYVYGRVNRRPVIIAGQTGVTVALTVLGGGFLLPESTGRNYLIIVAMLAFLFFFQGAIGTGYWLVTSEIFPLRFRGRAIGIAVFAQWIAGGVVTLVVPPVIEAVGGGTTFLVFAVINLGTLTFLVKLLPETRGHTLESLERRFRSYARV